MLELYGLPPEQFTAARNQLAITLRDAGDPVGSATVKGLPKPTIAAWLANRLVRIAPDQIAELTEFGEQIRDAHSAGDRLRLKQLTPRRHKLVQQLVNVARDDAQAAGRVITDAVAKRLTETLDAAVVDPRAAQLLRTGRLTSALQHVGFGVVDESGVPAAVQPLRRSTARGARPRTPSPRPPVTEAKPAVAARKTAQAQEHRRRRTELQQRLREVEADYGEAEKQRLAAESELDANEHHIADMQTAIQRLTDELERARQELRAAQGRTRRLERVLTRATRDAATARRRRDAQRQRLEAINE